MASEWCEAKFGASSADQVVDGVVRACLLAQEKASNAQEGSELSTNEPFGATFWVVLGNSAASELASVPGFSKARPKGGRFDVPAVNGVTIVVTKCAAGAGPGRDRLKVRWSALREEQLSGVERLPDSVLPLEEWSEEEEVDLARPDSPDNAAVLVVVVASAEGGIQHIYMGDGYLDAEGRVSWLYCEALPFQHVSPVAAVSGSEERPRFDEAPMPDLDLGLHEDDERDESAQ